VREWGKGEFVFSPCVLCVLRASAVKFFTVYRTKQEVRLIDNAPYRTAAARRQRRRRDLERSHIFELYFYEVLMILPVGICVDSENNCFEGIPNPPGFALVLE
jgi:hypothetical protein